MFHATLPYFSAENQTRILDRPDDVGARFQYLRCASGILSHLSMPAMVEEIIREKILQGAITVIEHFYSRRKFPNKLTLGGDVLEIIKFWYGTFFSFNFKGFFEYF